MITFNELKSRTVNFPNEEYKNHEETLLALSDGQEPSTLFISCSDSRVLPNLITQSGPGDVFVLRNAGNIMPAADKDTVGYAATLEYAVVALGVSDIVVCGHRCCGAMGALVNPKSAASLKWVAPWLKHAEGVNALIADVSEDKRLDRAIEANTLVQIENLLSYDFVQERVENKTLTLHAWVHDFRSGKTVAHDAETGTFKELT